MVQPPEPNGQQTTLALRLGTPTVPAAQNPRQPLERHLPFLRRQVLTLSLRTDNDIKNHFYSTLRRSLRRLNKMLGQKNSTSQMREIKPSVLSTIMNHIYGKHEADLNQNLCRSLKDLPSLIFEYANFKPVKNNLRCHRIDEAKTKIAEIFTLIASFNEQYEKAKEARHNGKTTKTKGKNESKKTDQIERRMAQIKIQQMECGSQKEEKQNEGTEVCIKAPESFKMERHSDEEDKEQEQEGKGYHPRNRNMSLDDDEIHEELQDIEQPSMSEGEGPDLMIVGKHWQPKSWQRELQMKEFVDEVLEISYGSI